jgi:flagellar assembly protein FliH
MSLFSEIRAHTFGPIVLDQPVQRGNEQSLPMGQVLEEPVDPEAIEAAAWAEGFERGYASGMRTARQEQEATLLQIVALTRNVVEDADEFTRALERQVVDLSLAVAEKIVERELRGDPTVVLDVIRGALDDIHGTTSATVHVHPEDHAIVTPHWERLARTVADRAKLVADERVERGGCLIETQMGIVDAQLSSKLSEIANGFEGVLEGEPL